MSLVAYTITALEETFANSQSSGKNIVVGAVCSMYSQPSDTVVTLYDDAAGSNGSTTKTTGADGQVAVYINPGEYRLSINGSDSFITISEMKPITTIDLIAQNRQIETGAIIETTGYTNRRDGGGGSWIQNGVTGQTASQSPAQLVGGLLNDANGNQWEYTSRPVKVKAMGAVPISTSPTADSTAAIQAAIYIFKDPSLVNLEAVIASGDATREIYGNEIDFDGGQYLVSNNIDYSLCHGIIITNGTVIADSGATWTAGDAIFQNKTNFCISPVWHRFTIDCNAVTNGIFVERGVYGWADDVRIWGFYNQEYGIKVASNVLGFTTNFYITECKLWGTVAAQAIVPAGITGDGIIITDSDCEITGGELSRTRKCITMSSAGGIRGVHLTGNDSDEAIGVETFGKTRNRISDCYFDNTILRCHPRETIISGNEFKTTHTPTNAQAIVLKSQNADDDMFDCVIIGNQAKLTNGTRFITIDESAGEFLEMGQCKVTDNICRDAAGGLPLPTAETQGVIIVDVTSSDFNGLAVQVNLSGRLLFPNSLNSKFNGAATATPNALTSTPYCKGMLYDPATTTLTILFSEEYTGQFGIAYSWGIQETNESAFTPAAPITSNQHSFSGYLNANATNTTGNGTVYPVVFDRERYDNGSIFNTGTGAATIKTGGVYTVESQVMLDNLSGATDILFTVEAGDRVFEDRRSGSFTGQFTMQITGGVFLSAADTIVCKVQVSGNGSDNVTINGAGAYRTFVSAMLMP